MAPASATHLTQDDLDKREEKKASEWYKLANLVATYCFPFLMLATGAAGAMLLAHDRQLTAMGANQYTIANAKEDGEKARAEREKISDRINKQDERIHALQLELRDGQYKILEEIQKLNK